MYQDPARMLAAMRAVPEAVALDHAEETGEYPPELVARVAVMFDQMVKAGPPQAGACDILVHDVEHGTGYTPEQDGPAEPPTGVPE